MSRQSHPPKNKMRNLKIETRPGMLVSIFQFLFSPPGWISGARLDDLNGQITEVHAVSVTLQADVTLIGNSAQGTLFGKNKRRIIDVDLMNPVSVQVDRQVPADAGDFHLVPLPGFSAHAIERNYRAVYGAGAVKVRGLPGVITEGDLHSGENRITLFGRPEQDSARRPRASTVFQAQNIIRVLLVRAQPSTLALGPEGIALDMPILRPHLVPTAQVHAIKERNRCGIRNILSH